MTRKTAFRSHHWLWALLLLAPVLVAHAESGDPLVTMREIPNRGAKADRLPIAYAAEHAWTSCRPTAPRRGGEGLEGQSLSCRDMAEIGAKRRDDGPGDRGR